MQERDEMQARDQLRDRRTRWEPGRDGGAWKRILKRFGEWIGRFAIQVHLGPRFGSLGARAIGVDPIEEWEQRKIEAEELDRKQALEPDDSES